MAAYVSVRGFVSAAIGVGIKLYAKMLTTLIIRFGSRSKGRRIRSAMRVDKQIVPNRVVIEWLKAAVTTSLDVGAGITLRWKYH